MSKQGHVFVQFYTPGWLLKCLFGELLKQKNIDGHCKMQTNDWLMTDVFVAVTKKIKENTNQ